MLLTKSSIVKVNNIDRSTWSSSNNRQLAHDTQVKFHSILPIVSRLDNYLFHLQQGVRYLKR